MLKIKNLYKSFGNTEVLKNINFNINRGETISFIGPSGSGKSTLLRCLIDLEEIDSGSIEVLSKTLFTEETKVSKVAKKDILSQMGLVFQSFNLFPHMTVLDNIVTPLTTVDKVDKAVAIEEAIKFLNKVGLEDKINSYPKELSGGQKQRVAIARALAKNPKILLFDEPTSALDPEMVKEVLSVISSLKELDITMLIVSHEMEFIKKISDRIFFMEDGEILASGSSNEIFKVEGNNRISDFLNCLNF